jgi:hypothetical protein
MNSDHDALSALIERVTALLNNQHIQTLFDDPIDIATSAFETSHRHLMPRTNAEFLQTLGKFVAYVYRQVPVLTQEVTPEHAQCEAVRLLENAYGGQSGWGYEHVLRFAVKHGYSTAYSIIAEGMKARHRQLYIQWVLVKHIAYLDTRTKTALIGRLLEDWSESLPEYFAERSAGELLVTCASMVQLQGNCLEDLDRLLGLTAAPSDIAGAEHTAPRETAETRARAFPQ